MIVKVASKVLKQPMEIFIPDSEWEEISEIENKDQLNSVLSKKALNQVAKYGYLIGYCEVNKKEVTLLDCLSCGARQRGWQVGLEGKYDKRDAKKATENINNWEKCKKENIHYKFMPNKPLLGKVDDKLLKKMQPETLQEKKQDSSTFTVIDGGNSEFDKQSNQFMKKVKDQ